jgi:hypothetical protein
LAYTYDASSTQTSLLRYSAGSWNAIETSLPVQYPNAIWADPQAVVLAGANQAMYVKRGSAAINPIAGAPAGDYYSVWGFSDTDLYAGNQLGQLLHYDGTSWTVVATTPTASPIAHIWGADGVVYFAGSEFGVWDGQSSRILLNSGVSGIWGLSKNEVFITLVDGAYFQYQCGGYYIIWFDGTEFHRF